MKRNKAWDGKSRGGAFGYGFFIFLIRHAGLGLAYAFLSVVAVYFIPFAPKATRAVWAYNRKILGYGRLKSARKLYAHYYVFGQTLIDRVACRYGMSDRYVFEFGNYRDFIRLLDAGPVIIIGAHAGCWEMGTSFFGQYASKLNIALYDGEDERVKAALKENPAGYKVVGLNGNGLESLLKIKLLLEKGEYICFQGDRFMEDSPVIRKTLLGHAASLPKGPFAIASKFRIPVVFYYAMREKPRRYVFHFTELPAGRSLDSIADAYVESLETVLGKYPQQWFNFYKFWQ